MNTTNKSPGSEKQVNLNLSLEDTAIVLSSLSVSMHIDRGTPAENLLRILISKIINQALISKIINQAPNESEGK